MQDPVSVFVACLVGVCAVGAIAILAFSSRRPAMPTLRRVPRVESSLVDWLGRMREEKRQPLPIRVIASDRMITPSGDLILRGDKFAFLDDDGPVPGTTKEVIGFDLPAVLLRPLGTPTPGVRPARIHPDELLSRWVRMDDVEEDEAYGRSSECAMTQVLPPPPSPDGEACASCGARRFRKSATTGQVECSVCGTVFAA